jgi:hypothetical protein
MGTDRLGGARSGWKGRAWIEGARIGWAGAEGHGRIGGARRGAKRLGMAFLAGKEPNMAKAKKKAKKKRVKYAIAPGYHVRKLDQIAFFTYLAAKHPDGSKPSWQQLIADSKNAKSPTHRMFDWNDKTAAQTNRRQMAQYYLRAVQVEWYEVEVSEETLAAPAVPAWIPTYRVGHRIPDDAYVPATEVLADNELAKEVVARAYKELEAWCRRYRRYGQFMGVFGEVVDAFAKITPTKIMARRPT